MISPLWSLGPLSVFVDEGSKKCFSVVRSTKDSSVFRPGRRHPALHRRKKKSQLTITRLLLLGPRGWSHSFHRQDGSSVM